MADEKKDRESSTGKDLFIAELRACNVSFVRQFFTTVLTDDERVSVMQDHCKRCGAEECACYEY